MTLSLSTRSSQFLGEISASADILRALGTSGNWPRMDCEPKT